MTEAGMLIDENATSPDDMAAPAEEPADAAFEEYTLNELEEMLEKAVEHEDYERASMIRDEIRKRKKE
jgi:hypothetical protein